MTGFPLLRLALVVLALVALAIPLAHITSRPDAKAPTSAPPTQPSPDRQITLALDATVPPATFEITLAGNALTTTADTPITLLIPAAGADLIVTATWDTPQSHALRIRATEDDLPILDQTLWATTSLEDVVTLPPTSAR